MNNLERAKDALYRLARANGRGKPFNVEYPYNWQEAFLSNLARIMVQFALEHCNAEVERRRAAEAERDTLAARLREYESELELVRRTAEVIRTGQGTARAAQAETPQPAKLIAVAVEREIWFLHVRVEVTANIHAQVWEGMKSAAKSDDFTSLVVTLPTQLAPVSCRSWRWKFEEMVVKSGGQLCFVDYMGDVDDMESERRSRAKLLAEAAAGE
jgi:hypothetical protein